MILELAIYTVVVLVVGLVMGWGLAKLGDDFPFDDLD